MTEDEQIMTALINRRGYLVVVDCNPLAAGKPVPGLCKGPYGTVETKQQFYSLGPTDFADFAEQAKLWEAITGTSAHLQDAVTGSHFYRIGTD